MHLPDSHIHLLLSATSCFMNSGRFSLLWLASLKHPWQTLLFCPSVASLMACSWPSLPWLRRLLVVRLAWLCRLPSHLLCDHLPQPLPSLRRVYSSSDRTAFRPSCLPPPHDHPRTRRCFTTRSATLRNSLVRPLNGMSIFLHA